MTEPIIKPFSEPSGMRIGDLDIETDQDRLIIFGNLELAKNLSSVDQIDKLIAILKSAKKSIETDPKSDDTKASVNTIDNPFR